MTLVHGLFVGILPDSEVSSAAFCMYTRGGTFDQVAQSSQVQVLLRTREHFRSNLQLLLLLLEVGTAHRKSLQVLLRARSTLTLRTG